jgi:chromosome segregation ATPase
MSTRDTSATTSMQGVDRVFEEFKTERQRSHQLQQENARLNIEVATLNQNLEIIKLERDQLNNEVYNQRRVIHEHKIAIESLQSEYSTLHQSFQSLEDEKIQIERLLIEQEEENQDLRVKFQQLRDDNVSLNLKMESEAHKLMSKEDLINALRLDLTQMKQDRLKFEHDHISTMNELNTQSIQKEDITSKNEIIEELERNLAHTKQTNDQLYDQLQQSLALNSEYTQQLQDVREILMEKHNKEQDYRVENEEIINKNDYLTREKQNFEETIKQLEDTLRSERNMSSSMKERSDSIQKNNNFLENQIKEIKELYEKTLSNNLLLEETYNSVKLTHNSLQDELFAQRKRNQDMELQLSSMVNNQEMKSELETLRKQLVDMRKKLLQKDLENESHGMISSQQLMEREQQGRQVSETIFESLLFLRLIISFFS